MEYDRRMFYSDCLLMAILFRNGFQICEEQSERSPWCCCRVDETKTTRSTLKRASPRFARDRHKLPQKTNRTCTLERVSARTPHRQVSRNNARLGFCAIMPFISCHGKIIHDNSCTGHSGGFRYIEFTFTFCALVYKMFNSVAQMWHRCLFTFTKAIIGLTLKP